MPDRDTVQDYRRIAKRRLEDSLELLQLPTRDVSRSDADTRHLRGAMYIAGYSVECIVKAYIIKFMQMETLREAIQAINIRRASKNLGPIENIAATAAGHRIAYMVELSDLPELVGYDAVLWGKVTSWNSKWRYDADTVERDKPEKFVKNIASALRWVESKL